jgi:hypothetical protein
MADANPLPLALSKPAKLLGGMRSEQDAAPLPGGARYTTPKPGGGMVFNFPPGALMSAQFLTADFLLQGRYVACLQLALYEPKTADGHQRIFRFTFGLLGQCSARLRVPLSAVDQNQWSFAREGACLKRMAGGDRVDLEKVDQLTLTVVRQADEPLRFCMTPITATTTTPEPLTKPLLPKGPLLDDLGQSTLANWTGKTKDAAECVARLRTQLADAPQQQWPATYDQWGGDKSGEPLVKGAGFFGKHFDGRRWWLTDPDGRAFFSAGMDSVRPDVGAAYHLLDSALTFLPDARGEFASAHHGRREQVFDYLTANLIRAFGAQKWHEDWATIALSHLRAWGFNTVANWSEDQVARAARFPYVMPMRFRLPTTPMIFRDFPDAFSPTLDADAAAFADQLRPNRDDPAMIGYFLMNEPTWGFASETIAAGMLYTHASSHARDTFATALAERYRSDAALAVAWNMPGLTLASVASGRWTRPLDPKARPDCAAFSTIMVEKLFTTLSKACKTVDPNHLNLGARYHTTPPPWALAGMTAFDVFSINCYQERVSPNQLKTITDTLGIPVIIGEYHFGALDVGLPASGIGRVASQADRGRAFRIYTEQAATLPQCVGVHYFTMYDQSALGRFDGENYNIGFLDTCNRPYAELAAAARISHERIYDVARGKKEPFADAPQYLPKLFL